MITPNTTTIGIQMVTASESLDDDEALVCCWSEQLQGDWGVAVIVTDEILVMIDVVNIGINTLLVTVVGNTCTLQLGVIGITDVCCSGGQTAHDAELMTVSLDGSPSSIIWFITIYNSIYI